LEISKIRLDGIDIILCQRTLEARILIEYIKLILEASYVTLGSGEGELNRWVTHLLKSRRIILEESCHRFIDTLNALGIRLLSCWVLGWL